MTLSLLLVGAGCAAALPKADRDLFAAVESDDVAEVDRVLATGADIDASHGAYFEGLPPLGWAAAHGSTKAVEALLARGAKVDAANQHGDTPLHVAAYDEKPAVVALLLRHGANVDARNDRAWTPLHEAMERLAMAPATKTPSAAEVARAVDVVEALLAGGARVETPGAVMMPIHLAALTGQRPLVRMLLDRGAAVDPRGNDRMTPLYLAARKDATEVASLLIARGAEVDARTKSLKTPLMCAAEEGNVRVARLLVQHHADVDARDVNRSSALIWASRALLARYTLEASTPGARDVRARSLRGLSGREATVAMARGREALSETKGEFGEVARLLVAAGADPNVSTPELTPLGVAATVGDEALARALMGHVANLDDTSTGESALHTAIAERHSELAALIVDAGADVNVRNVSRLTPLHFLAVNLRDRGLAELLIRRGADVNARDREGHTPLELAERAHNDDVAEVLRRHGAR